MKTKTVFEVISVFGLTMLLIALVGLSPIGHWERQMTNRYFVEYAVMWWLDKCFIQGGTSMYWILILFFGPIFATAVHMLLESIGINTDIGPFRDSSSSYSDSDDYSGIGSDWRWERKWERERQDRYDKRINDILYGDDD
jgi:hypothetical protein